MAVGIPQLLLIVAISTFENDTMLRHSMTILSNFILGIMNA